MNANKLFFKTLHPVFRGIQAFVKELYSHYTADDNETAIQT